MQAMKAFIAAVLIFVAFTTSPAGASAEPALAVSKLADRSFARELEGQTVAGNIYVFLTPDNGISQVRFYLDDRTVSRLPVTTEKTAPFDLAGGAGWANAFDTRRLRDGTHTVTAVITKVAGAAKTITASFKVNNSIPHDRALYWGASMDGVPWDMKKLSTWEALVSNRPSIIHFWEPWIERGVWQPFDPQLMQTVRDHGAIPMLTWLPTRPSAGADHPNYQLSDIIAGKHDASLTDWAADARNWGNPLFLRWGHEMNGFWFPWSEDANGNKRGEFAQAWRHIVDIFRAAGAHNVTWVWCPNVDWAGSGWPALQSLYPGDDYVDWTCLDGFNWGVKNGGWKKFDEIFRWSYENIMSFAPDKPMMIGELGASEKGGSKPAWIRETFGREVPVDFPGVKAIVLYNHVDDQDWRIETSFGSVEAFRAAVASPHYRSNAYDSLTAAPIASPD